MVDFGVEESFIHASERLFEHYEINISPGRIRNSCLIHGENLASQELKNEIPDQKGVKCILSGSDGTMIPVVTFDKETGNKDCRKKRQTQWREAKLCMSRDVDKVRGAYKAEITNVDRAGDFLLDTAISAGMGNNTKVHFVGDGASWIQDQADRVFGGHMKFLVDFYHVCEYLSNASKEIEKQDWDKRQQKRLKSGNSKGVITTLKRIKKKGDFNEESGVSVCLRYLENRRDQLWYDKAIESDLPIGSGELESSHRHVIQKRLKISGAWWTTKNANKMLALRTLRASGDWKLYWNELEVEGLEAA